MPPAVDGRRATNLSQPTTLHQEHAGNAASTPPRASAQRRRSARRPTANDLNDRIEGGEATEVQPCKDSARPRWSLGERLTAPYGRVPATIIRIARRGIHAA
jgi:hypothetical protein